MKYIIRKLDSAIHYNKVLSILHYYLTYSVGGEIVEITLQKHQNYWTAVSECAGYMRETEIPVWGLTSKALVLSTKELAANAKFYADVCRAQSFRKIQKQLSTED